MKSRRSSFCVADGVSGYEAAMVCRSVQALLPNRSTSGGQSEGKLLMVAFAGVVAVMCLAGSVPALPFREEVQDANAAPDVHERQLQEMARSALLLPLGPRP